MPGLGLVLTEGEGEGGVIVGWLFLLSVLLAYSVFFCSPRCWRSLCGCVCVGGGVFVLFVCVCVGVLSLCVCVCVCVCVLCRECVFAAANQVR